MAKVLYYMTKSKGKCGCTNTTLWRSDCYETKAELKKKRCLCKFEFIYTEEQIIEKFGEEKLKWFEEHANRW